MPEGASDRRRGAMSQRQPYAAAEHAGAAGGPLPRLVAWRAVVRCFATSLRMLLRGEVGFPTSEVGRRIESADSSTARVYRDTTVGRPVAEPCFLAVTFRLRAVRGRGHAWFRVESLLIPALRGVPGLRLVV